jgi:hypothetical protein
MSNVSEKVKKKSEKTTDVSGYLVIDRKNIPSYSMGDKGRKITDQNWHKNKRVYIVDYGSKKRKFFILDCYRKRFLEATNEEFLKFPNKHKNSIIIAEYAHMQASNGISLSQPLLAEQKQIFLDNCRKSNVCLKYFPENKTPKARIFAQKINSELGKKSDMHDTIAIYLYLRYFPNIYSTLSSKDSISSNIVQESQIFRTQTDLILMKGRYNEYKNDYISDFIEEHKESLYEYLKDTPEALDIFGITKDKKDNISYNTKILYTVLATLVDNQGNPRIRQSTGQTPGWKFIADRDFCLNQNKGGVSKSNLNFHFINHSFARKFDFAKNVKPGKKKPTFDKILNFNESQYEEFISYRKMVKSILKKIFYYFKEKI